MMPNVNAVKQIKRYIISNTIARSPPTSVTNIKYR
ncbi:hypothetical protein DERF_014004 [Dermatophagoides farinae]|uniref:Uncharacterized protein n=1 Tax=Dermatophagoides farinae TaxID=6954 RepID=A0A922HQT5_DERFA|nr:hypothetical protein DERF_014004 [Dermatophagoides farinae]